MAMAADDLWAVSAEEFLAGERIAETKSEWVSGVVYNMAGASKKHVRVVSNVFAALAPAAGARGCFIGVSDLLVQTEDAFYYPDLVISCDPSDDSHVETRPCFIVEVLSPSTKRADKHEKRDAYCALETMQDYWIVDPELRVVEAYHRVGDGWESSHYTASALLNVTCLDLQIRVVDAVGNPLD